MGTIVIQNETRELLKRLARKAQTYDDLIRELVVTPLICQQCGKNIEYSMSGRGLTPAPRQLNSSDKPKEEHD